MHAVSNLVAFGLRLLVGDAADKVVENVEGWFVDSSHDLIRAVDRANEQAWHALALALGGEGWLSQASAVMNADVRTFRDQVSAFLRQSGSHLGRLPDLFRRDCLRELKVLREQGLLSAKTMSPRLLGKQAAGFQRYVEPRAVAAEAKRAIGLVAADLAPHAPNLAKLLAAPVPEGPPLLAAAFSYFLRHELAENPRLSSTMLLDGVEHLLGEYAAGLTSLHTALRAMGGRLDVCYQLVFEQLDGIELTVVRTHSVVDEANQRIVYLQRTLEELHRQQDRQRLEMSAVRQLIQEMLDAVRSSPAAVSNDGGRAAVEELLARSPLTAAVRTMMEEALEAELAARRRRLRGRTPGERRAGPLGMPLAWIPPGWYVRGSSPHEPDRDDDEGPHKVILSRGFWLGVHPVTQGQWQAVMGSRANPVPEDDRPAECLSWHECTAFLARLRQHDAKAYRLPTEAEWEYACRAGTTTPFAFGTRLNSDQANFNDAAVSRAQTTRVGLFAPNAWGMYDMHGNVLEWCADWYGAYPVGATTDPVGSAFGEARVLRGGCWWSPMHACRSAHRYAANPEADVLPSGFRVCLADEEESSSP